MTETPEPRATPGDEATDVSGSRPVRFEFLTGTLVGWLVVVAVTLVVLHVVFMFWHFCYQKLPWAWLGLFDLDEEESFGTWFSSGLLFAAAIVSWLCAWGCAASQRDRGGWWWLGAGFCVLSADEVAGIHESVNTVTPFSWAIPGGILAVVVGLAYLPFLRRLPPRTRRRVFTSGVVFVLGAIGVELATEGYIGAKKLDTLEYNLTTALEEGLEMLGVILFIHAGLDHFAGAGRITVDIDNSP